MGMSDILTFECALVTGASSGLGEEYARQLADRCEKLVLVARREPVMERLAEDLRAEHAHIEVEVIAADLANDADRVRLVETLQAKGLVPDLLVNNAGLGDYGEFATAEWPRLEAMMRVNMEALTHLTHALVPGMVAKGGGAVMNVSSLASILPIPDFAVYAATKAYVTSFSEALRIELKEHGIPVLAVCPGPVHTGFGAVARREANRKELPGRESFYVEKEQVVAESLMALDGNKARVYPHFKTAAAAFFISAVPIVLLRLAMGCRPRKG